jgi:hypothetical protein
LVGHGFVAQAMMDLQWPQTVLQVGVWQDRIKECRSE